MTKEPRYYIDSEGNTQATFAASERPEDELCDFCMKNQHPMKVFLCREFSIDNHVFLPEWLACDKCAPFIDAGDRIGLLRRCIVKHECDIEGATKVAFVQGAFFQNKL